MSSYMAGVFDLDLDVDTVEVADSDEDDIIDVDEVCLSFVLVEYVEYFRVNLKHFLHDPMVKDNFIDYDACDLEFFNMLLPLSIHNFY